MGAGVRPNTGVDFAFSAPARMLTGLDVWITILGYGFQLFFNFCGYSHLVIGAARLFGFRLAENFNRPYLSTTTSEFWTRWHMSLSFWIRDYVFFPLATLRPEMWWRHLSLVIAMFVFGLWHKGSVLFMVWGIYHGLLLVAHRQWQQLSSRTGLNRPTILLKPVAWVFTFSAISLGWIFFRAENVHKAATMLKAAFSLNGFVRIGLPKSFYALVLMLAAGYFVVVTVAELMNRWGRDYTVRDISSGVIGGQFEPSPSAWSVLAQNRWVWIGPVVAVLTLYLYLILKPEVAGASPMLYRLF
jgi:alginate O-acetyltransferase complex protein AlgI